MPGIPALTGIDEKLKAGGKVADIGCGHGSSTIIMAQAYPNSEFWGFDYHEPSIHHAQEAAAKAGVSDRTTFEVAAAKEYPGDDYDQSRGPWNRLWPDEDGPKPLWPSDN